MDISTLFTEFTKNGVTILNSGEQIRVGGKVQYVTSEHKAFIQANGRLIASFLPESESTHLFKPTSAVGGYDPNPSGTPLDAYEKAEREAIQFADSPERMAEAERIGSEFIAMAAEDHWAFLLRRISEQETLDEVIGLAERFENDLCKYETYRPIAERVRFAIRFRQHELTEVDAVSPLMRSEGPTVQGTLLTTEPDSNYGPNDCPF